MLNLKQMYSTICFNFILFLFMKENLKSMFQVTFIGIISNFDYIIYTQLDAHEERDHPLIELKNLLHVFVKTFLNFKR